MQDIVRIRHNIQSAIGLRNRQLIIGWIRKTLRVVAWPDAGGREGNLPGAKALVDKQHVSRHAFIISGRRPEMIGAYWARVRRLQTADT